jgi:hypothetical protein
MAGSAARELSDGYTKDVTAPSIGGRSLTLKLQSSLFGRAGTVMSPSVVRELLGQVAVTT